MEDFKGSHVHFDLNDSQASYSPSSSSSFSVCHASLCSDQENDNKVKSCGEFFDHSPLAIGNTTMDKSNFWKDQVEEDHQVEDHDHEDDSYKWMPSKMRILRKMMMMSSNQTEGPDSTQKFEDQKQFPSTTINQPNTARRASYKNMIDHSVRVCSDCNTTKTPLWRSGPRGPKSLCNACGIRQRKARRAMAVAAAAASGAILPVSAPPLKIKVKHKKKRSRGLLHDPQLKKTRKGSPKSSPSNGTENNNELVGFEDFTSRVLSKNCSGYGSNVFPQDEKEAAILLMALSCGIV